MKQTLLSFLLSILPICSIWASVDSVEYDGIYYNIVKKAKLAKVISKPNGKYNGPNIKIPAKIIYEGEDYAVSAIETGAFFECKNVKTVVLPNTIETIGNSAFQDCIRLESIIIPDGVTTIEDYAFWGCSGATSVVIPPSVRSFGSGVFYECEKLSSVHISDMEAWFNISFYGVSSNPLLNARHLYLNNEEIIDLVIPSTVTSIKNYLFCNCIGIQSVTIHNSVTSIGWGTFFGCSNIKSIEIPNSVTSIGTYAFEYCSGLSSVTLPNTLTSLSTDIFSGCIGLTSITIPDGIVTIGESAFWDCSSLSSVVIPKSVTSIKKYAFGNCEEISDVYCFGKKVPSTHSDAFLRSEIKYATLHVPEGSIEKYKTTKPWNDFGNIVAISDDLTNIASHVQFDSIDNQVSFTLGGRHISKLHKGLNIVRMNNGQMRKILIK